MAQNTGEENAAKVPRSRRRRPRSKPKSGSDSTASNVSNGSEPRPETSGSVSDLNGSNAKVPEAKSRRRKPRNPVVARPKPKSEATLGARAVELGQIQLLYKFSGNTNHADSVFSLRLKPSDPDFAYNISELEFDLHVPLEYPSVVPWINITNEDIPRGYAANAEIGFRDIAVSMLGKHPLMRMLMELDKNLERFLQQEQRPTIKIVRPIKSVAPSVLKTTNKTVDFSKSELARHKDALDTLVHRLGDRISRLSSSDHESVYRVKIIPPYSEILPQQLTNYDIVLHVPIRGACWIKVDIGEGDIAQLSQNLEAAFNEHAKAAIRWSYTALLNFLQQKTDLLMLPDFKVDVPVEGLESLSLEADADTVDTNTIKTVESNTDLDTITTVDSNTDTADPDTTVESNTATVDIDLKKGTELEVPGVVLHNIGYLQAKSLNVVVVCTKCKTKNEIYDIRPAPYGQESPPVGGPCSHCSTLLGIAFRQEIVHANNSTLGYLDLGNCRPIDLLSSEFHPTCGTCSEQSMPPKSVTWGRPQHFVCRSCHAKATLTVPEFRFVLHTTDDLDLSRVAKSAKARQSQSIKLTGGTPLPDEGRCAHYKKSTRWFRFSCCNRVYPCDKCHDAESDHAVERANRMVCGKCSREQKFTDKACQYCGHSYEVRHSAFWEGGKGTRDQSKMSRNDPRKHKRIAKQT